MPTIKRILVLPHTHHDVGYTHSARIVDPMHARIVTRVLDLAEHSILRGDDPASQFRWTFEVSRPVLTFLATAGANDIERLRRLAQAGAIAVTGGYLNMTTLGGAAELDHSLELVDRIRAAGLPVRTVQHGDVNGLPWGQVAAMRRRGLDRLVMALNPDHGRAPLPQPSAFGWQGPDGAQILVWLSTHYGFGESWGLLDADLALLEPAVDAFIAELESRRDYPFDVAVIHAANDNRWPNDTFCRAIRAWNQTHPDLPMSTVTVDQMFDQLQPTGPLPRLRGEWSDWWSHGHGSTTRELAVHRQARRLLLTAGASLASARLRGEGEVDYAEVIGYRRGPVFSRTEHELSADIESTWEQLLLFTEHTWGAWESFSKPESMLTNSSWNAKAAMAYTAWDQARSLAVEGLWRLMASGKPCKSADPAGPDPARSTAIDDLGRALPAAAQSTKPGDPIVVFNPVPRPRRIPICVEVDQVHRRIVVPPRPLAPLELTRLPAPAAPANLGEGTVLDTGRYRVEVDPSRGGVISLIDHATGTELLDPTAFTLGALVAQVVPPDCTHPFATGSPTRFRPQDPGPDFDLSRASSTEPPTLIRAETYTAIRWRTACPQAQAEAELRVYDELDLLDLDVRITKPEQLGPESLLITFPFAISAPEFLIEGAGSVFQAGPGQLPDTAMDYYSIQHAVGVRSAGPARAGMLWGSADIPLVQLGQLRTGVWARSLAAQSGLIAAWVANNLHFTNFRRQQHGVDTYHFRFAPAAPVDAAQVARFGDDLLMPPMARQYAGPIAADGARLFSLSDPGAVLAELTPIGSAGEVRLRLRSICPNDTTLTVTWLASPVRVVGMGAGIGIGASATAGALPQNLVRPDGRVLGAGDWLEIALRPAQSSDLILSRP